MKKTANSLPALLALLVVTIVAASACAGGSGSLKLGWSFLDEEGNQATAYRAFNEYEGAAISLENIRYRFNNTGHILRADLRNITLNNRNLSLSLTNPGRYGISFYNSQYRRVYSFDGGSFTRRNQTGGTFQIYPHKNLKLYAGAARVARSGESVDLFNFNGSPNVNEDPRFRHDYTMSSFNGGFDLIERGGVLRGEMRTTNYTDNERPDRDQNRQFYTVSTAFPVPRLEMIMVHAGYRRLQSKYEADDFEIWSNFAWGGATITLPKGFNFRYNLYFDRSGSDSDYVETDNLANAFYLGYTKDRRGGVTVGYQHDINDDFEDEVQANSYYLSGWIKPTSRTEFRAQYGNRAEEVKEGARLLGDEDRSRYSLSGKYRVPGRGHLSLKYEGRQRKNDNLGTEADFNRFLADVTLISAEFGSLSGGYSYATGEYSNIEANDFEFQDHVLYGEATSREFEKTTLGFGATYYRSKRDLDVESFSLRFSGSYRLGENYRLEAEYNVHNFDDFLVADKYYTSNVLEVSISRDFSL